MTVAQYCIARVAAQDAARINAGEKPRADAFYALTYTIDMATFELGPHECLTAPGMLPIWKATARLSLSETTE